MSIVRIDPSALATMMQEMQDDHEKLLFEHIFETAGAAMGHSGEQGHSANEWIGIVVTTFAERAGCNAFEAMLRGKKGQDAGEESKNA